jgi:hypothetical protein
MLTNQKQVRAAFWNQLPDYLEGEARIFVKGRRQNQYPTDTRCAFVDFVDMLARNGDISESLAQRVTL